tara:strand:+ start:11919 stop:12584 length:666 start_codon:yes stop_codon:yes gene_type:complete
MSFVRNSDAIDWVKGKLDSSEKLTWDDIIELIRFAQDELGVAPDGKPGAKTLSALRANSDSSSDVPIPRGRIGMKKVYGDPSWVKLPRGRAVDLDDDWEKNNIRWFRLHTGKRVRLHKLIGHEFVALFEKACKESGYTPKSVQTFVPRVIGGTNRLSTHALGIGIDFDPRENAMGGRNLVNPNEPTLVRQFPKFLEVFRSAGYTCGADWKMKDDMHIQRGG